MSSTTYSEFEDWLPRPAAFKLAIGLWVAGFAVAGAAAWHMQRAEPQPGPTSSPTFSSAGAAADYAPADSAGPAAVEVLPEDVVVGHRAPTPGVTLRQKP
jgi:hypothetical protein